MLFHAMNHSKKIMQALQRLVDPLMIIFSKRNGLISRNYGDHSRRECLKKTFKMSFDTRSFEKNIKNYLRKQGIVEEERKTTDTDIISRVGLRSFNGSILPGSRQGRREFDDKDAFGIGNLSGNRNSNERSCQKVRKKVKENFKNEKIF